MHVTWTFTGYGLLAFAGGALALIGVWLSNRRSVRNVQMQLDAEKKARVEEQERKVKAVATALLFEIAGFYATHLRQPRGLLEGKNVEEDNLPMFTSVGADPFPVYRGTTGNVGELPVECVQAVVGFFSMADSTLSNLVDYTASFERARRIRSALTVTDPDFAYTGEYSSQMDLAGTQLGRIKGALPEAIKAAYLVCHTLCQFTGVAFQYPVITVAAEKLTIEKITDSLTDAIPSGDNRGED